MRLLIISLFSFWQFTTFAQHKEFMEPIGWGGNRIELQTITSKSKKSSCVFVQSYDSIRAFVFNSQIKVMRSFCVLIKSWEVLLGGCMRDSSVYLFTELRGIPKLHCWVLNIINGNTRESDIPFDLQNERSVTQLSAGNRFVFVTANNKINELTLYSFTSEGPGIPVRKRFSDAQWDDLTTGGLFKNHVKLEKIDQEGDVNPEALVKNNKVYLHNDTVLVVMNNHLDSTHVVCFDLDQYQASGWVINHNPGQPARSTIYYSDNSFLFRDKLYYVQATYDSLKVQIVDPYSGAINKSWTTGGNEEIDYKNTSILQEGGTRSKRDFGDLDNTSELLKKMVNGSAVITAKPAAKDQIEIVVGSYKKVTVTTTKPAAGATMVTSATGAPMMVPAASVSHETWTKSAHFKSLLDAGDYTHREGEPGTSINERIERYTNNLKIPPESENLFMNNGTYYYAYYDKGARTLVVLKF